MTFLDTNIFVYAVGNPHPLQEAVWRFFADSTEQGVLLCTSAEVLQELAHIYLRVGRRSSFDAAISLLARFNAEVWPLEADDVLLARQLHEQHPNLLRTSDRSVVPMAMIQLEISDYDRERFARQAERQGLTLDAWLIAVARQRVAEPDPVDDGPQPGKAPSGNAGQSILEMFDEIHRSMPEGAFDELPTDGSINLKHYLYGWPKEEDR